MRMDVITGTKSKDGEKTYWTNCGSAWVKEDGKISIKLNTLPITGELLLVKPKEKEQTE